jgi:hypothetical protein
MNGKLHRLISDPIISLKDLQDEIYILIGKFGEDAILTTDAGYNNVDLVIDNRKKSIKGYKKEWTK